MNLHTRAVVRRVGRCKFAETDGSCRLKRNLEFDPVKEQFVNDAEADALITRQYRDPYTVPETV